MEPKAIHAILAVILASMAGSALAQPAGPATLDCRRVSGSGGEDRFVAKVGANQYSLWDFGIQSWGDNFCAYTNYARSCSSTISRYTVYQQTEKTDFFPPSRDARCGAHKLITVTRVTHEWDRQNLSVVRTETYASTYYNRTEDRGQTCRGPQFRDGASGRSVGVWQCRVVADPASAIKPRF